ncbi:type II toxin-antitoxin system HicA family toxin [Candidatus Woesearchaeota archaeon]|nr:type II toxin-antitoxin system HicA family toxin [Candidatus Woesearchaeota archaeon]
MKLPLISSNELCKFLEKEGFRIIRQKGSHRFYRHPDGRTTVVPMHSGKDIKRGLLKGILNEIKISREEFFRKFK